MSDEQVGPGQIIPASEWVERVSYCDHWVGAFGDGGLAEKSSGTGIHATWRFRFCPKCGHKIDWSPVYTQEAAK